MEIIFENIKSNDWEFSTTLTGEDIIGVTGPEYEELLEVGVKIYEFKGGFTHSKMFISDDVKAVVGSINLDYRSLYLHFEDAVYIYKNKIINNIKKDFIDMFNNSNEITLDNMKKFNIIKKIIGRILRFLAPLM